MIVAPFVILFIVFTGALIGVAPVVLVVVALSLLTRRERHAPPPAEMDEMDAGVARMDQRVANIEEILLHAKRV